MAHHYVSLRNIQFQLFEVLRVQQLQSLGRFSDWDQEGMQMALDSAKQLADQYLFPYYRAMDREKAYYKDGEVWVHPSVGSAIRAMGDAGWISAQDDYEQGGQQMPYVLHASAVFLFNAANPNIAPYPFLTQGAANLLRSFAGHELRERYMPKMYAGEWQGTMALTEPQAGSSLSDITTTATPAGSGAYRIRGQKIYISGGDHNGADNVVHLLLARIEGAPPGTRGISLFVVPKLRPENGELKPNDVTTAGIYGKMGQKGYVAAHLMLGESEDCIGYLVGEPHKGLKYMFQMMNEARVGTGLMAAGTTSAAYYASLQYARERPQGRHPSNKDLDQPQVPIIEHADVRRMLLLQKAVVEAGYGLLAKATMYADLSLYSDDQKQREEAHQLFELLTPVIKSWPSEMGNISVSAGMQVLGGAGYTDDFPLEQYYRDIRVNAIYEGTTGIHGMDLLGRKMTMENGKAAQLFMAELQETVRLAGESEPLQPLAEQLSKEAGLLQKTTARLLALAAKEPPEVFLADATLFLDYFGQVTMAWQLLEQGIVAQRKLEIDPPEPDRLFYQSKLHALHYFYEYELVKTCGWRERLSSENRVTLHAKPEEIV